MKPNVLVVVLDALRARNLSCYGHHRPTSPRIDELASESVVFERAISPSGTTIDSTASLFSGRYPIEHQSGRQRAYGAGEPTLPQHLSEQGYETAVVSANPFITPWFGFDTGVDMFSATSHRFERGMNVREFFDRTKHLPAWRRYAAFLRESLDFDFPWHVGNALHFKYGLYDEGDDGARTGLNEVTRFVDDTDSPWFSYAHLTETHMNSADAYPYAVPGEYRFEFVDERPDSERFRTRTTDVDYDEETQELHERLYDGAIKYLDTQLGRLFDALRDRGDWEDTLVVITSDHGECLGEHGLLGHGNLREPGVHVPLIVKPPAEADISPDRVHRRVNTISLFRTIASLCGNVPERPRGENLFDSSDDEHVLTQDFSSTWDWSEYETEEGGISAIYDGSYKLIASDLREELYVVDEQDGREERVRDEAETARLRSLLDDLLSELDVADETGAGEVSGETSERLRELGYLE